MAIELLCIVVITHRVGEKAVAYRDDDEPQKVE